MRLWSIHPSLLDRRALVACWREALLAQKVLAGGTKGYTHHPQLVRFRACDDPQAAIGTYLTGLADAAEARDYKFNRSLIVSPSLDPLPEGFTDGSLTRSSEVRIAVTTGQMSYEWQHLRTKVAARDPEWFHRISAIADPHPHPMFVVRQGPVEDWEVR